MESHSFTCHPHMNHTCLYSPAAWCYHPLAGTQLNLTTKGSAYCTLRVESRFLISRCTRLSLYIAGRGTCRMFLKPPSLSLELIIWSWKSKAWIQVWFICVCWWNRDKLLFKTTCNYYIFLHFLNVVCLCVCVCALHVHVRTFQLPFSNRILFSL